jgi:hypothetical protein
MEVERMLGRLARVTVVGVLLTAGGVAAASPADAAAKHYANCTALNRTYKHGVGRKGAHDKVRGKSKPVTNFTVNTAVYNANHGLDRDHDGVACEKR